MNSPFKIIILPSEKATKWLYSPLSKKISEYSALIHTHINEYVNFFMVNTIATIEQGDWCIDMHNLQVTGIIQVESEWQRTNLNNAKNPESKFVTKIISSTNEDFGLPIISKKIIEELIESNKKVFINRVFSIDDKVLKNLN